MEFFYGDAISAASNIKTYLKILSDVTTNVSYPLFPCYFFRRKSMKRKVFLRRFLLITAAQRNAAAERHFGNRAHLASFWVGIPLTVNRAYWGKNNTINFEQKPTILKHSNLKTLFTVPMAPPPNKLSLHAKKFEQAN